MHSIPQEALEESFRSSSKFGTVKLGKNTTLHTASCKYSLDVFTPKKELQHFHTPLFAGEP